MSNSNEPPSPRSLTTPQQQQHFASSFGNVQLQPVSPSPVPQSHNVFANLQNTSKMQQPHQFQHSYSPMLQPPLLPASTTTGTMKQQQQDVTAAMNSIMNSVPSHFSNGLIPPPIQYQQQQQQPHQQQQQQQQLYHHPFHHQHHIPHHHVLANSISSTPAPMMVPSPAQPITAVAQRSANAASKKRKINKLACQYCSKLHKKCDGDSPMPCTRCHAKGVECVYVQRAKRGPKTKRQKQGSPTSSNNSNGNAAPPNATPASPLSETNTPMTSLDAHASMSSLLPQPSIPMHHMSKQSYLPQHLQPQNWNRIQLGGITAPTPPPQPVLNNMFTMYPQSAAQPNHNGSNNNGNVATMEHHSVQNYPFLSQTPHPSFYQPMSQHIPYAPTPTPSNPNNNWSTLPNVSFSQQQQQQQQQQPAMVQTPNPFPYNLPSSNFQFMQPLDLSSFSLPTLATNGADGHHQDAFPSVTDVPAPYEEHDDAFHRQ